MGSIQLNKISNKRNPWEIASSVAKTIQESKQRDMAPKLDSAQDAKTHPMEIRQQHHSKNIFTIKSSRFRSNVIEFKSLF